MSDWDLMEMAEKKEAELRDARAALKDLANVLNWLHTVKMGLGFDVHYMIEKRLTAHAAEIERAK